MVEKKGTFKVWIFLIFTKKISIYWFSPIDNAVFILETLYMKYLLLTIITVLTLNSFAQLSAPVKLPPTTRVGKIGTLGTLIAELEYYINPDDATDTIYLLTFKDYKYSHIDRTEQLSFSGKGGVIDQLYTLFKSAFTDENRGNKDYAVSVTLGKDAITIASSKSMGFPTVIFLRGSSYGTLTERQVDKLFAK